MRGRTFAAVMVVFAVINLLLATAVAIAANPATSATYNG